jgi:excisionase family DNA binding protein
MADGMLSLNEVMQYLDLDKEGVEELVRQDRLTAYKIGGVYLRFKKDQVMGVKLEKAIRKRKKSYLRERLADFWDFNNFYIVTGICLIFILYFVLR